jgi:hypothetical protein
VKRALVWIIVLAGSFVALTGQAEEVPAPVLHPPIWIDGNDSFTKGNGVVAGKGTAADPFVIEGWLFEAGETGIGIANTDAFFVIRACRFARISNSDGIFLARVSNGRVEDCVVDGTAGRCIGLNDSSDCAIVRCDLTNTAQAAVIALWGCTRITVTDNSIRSVRSWTSWCGVALWGTTSSHVSRNTITDCSTAIALNRDVDRGLDSIGNTVDSNTMSHSEGPDISVEETSIGNLFFHDNFGSYLGVSNAAPRGGNAWDNGSEGNRWGGMGGWDPNGDGIDDVPYSIEGGDADRYPLMRAWRDGVVVLGVRSTGADEWVTIRNWGQGEVCLDGWKLESIDTKTKVVLDSFPFAAGLTIPAGGTIVVHSGSASRGKADDGVGTASADLWSGWQQALQGKDVWNDIGGTVRLVDADGRVVDELEYGWWMGS